MEIQVLHCCHNLFYHHVVGLMNETSIGYESMLDQLENCQLQRDQH